MIHKNTCAYVYTYAHTCVWHTQVKGYKGYVGGLGLPEAGKELDVDSYNSCRLW